MKNKTKSGNKTILLWHASRNDGLQLRREMYETSLQTKRRAASNDRHRATTVTTTTSAEGRRRVSLERPKK